MNKKFENMKIDFISRIPSNFPYYFDLFEYNNIFYVIPIHKEIAERCSFLKGIIDKYPSFGSSAVMATYNSIIEGFFDAEYFVHAVINMMILLKVKYGLVELDNYEKEYIDYDENYYYKTERDLVNLCPINDIPIHSFLNTHHAIFCYFKYYSIEDHFTLSMLANVFNRMLPGNPTDNLFNNYFGFHNGNEVPRDMSKFNSNRFIYNKIDLATIGDIVNDEEYDEMEFVSGNGSKLVDMDVIPMKDFPYLKLMFQNLPFERSKHIMVKTTKSDDRLSKIDRYLDIDDVLYLKYDSKYKIPSGVNLKVIGYDRIRTDFDDKINNIIFDEKLRELEVKYCYKFKNIKTITFLGDIDSIPIDFCSNSSVEQVNLKNVKLIDSFFLSGCGNIKELIINGVEKIGLNFIAHSAINKLDINTHSIKSVGSFFARSSKIVNIDLLWDNVTYIGDHFMDQCKSLSSAKFNFPKLKYIPDKFLSECSSLQKFELILTHETAYIGNKFLYDAKSLTKFIMPIWPYVIKDDFLGLAKNLVSISHVGNESKINVIGNRFLKGAVGLHTFSISNQPFIIGEEFMSDCPLFVNKNVFENEHRRTRRTKKLER